MNKYNLMYMTDFYKIGHINQYPKGTTNVYSVWTARSTKFANTEDNKVVHFGVKYYISKLKEFENWFFNLSEDELRREMAEYQQFLSKALNTQVRIGHWYELYELGYLPLKIKSYPEAVQYDIQKPLVTVENTVNEFYWLTNFIETSLSSNLWLASNSATIAYELRKFLDEFYVDHTEDEKAFVDYQCHDFSYRGMGGDESAVISGLGHLAFFKGSDNIPAIKLGQDIYGYTGGSVPATEHAVMCAGGQDDEFDTIERIIDTYPTGIVSIVSDTWDYFNTLNNIYPKLKEKIESREGKVVVRPDSGNPYDIIMESLDIFEKHFSYGYDSTGLKVFNKIGLIYGEGMSIELIKKILIDMKAKGFSPLNIVFGVGSFTYQYNTRDTLGFAMKATSVTIDGETKDIVKTPVTDPGKNSLTGRFDEDENLKVVYVDGMGIE